MKSEVKTPHLFSHLTSHGTGEHLITGNVIFSPLMLMIGGMEEGGGGGRGKHEHDAGSECHLCVEAVGPQPAVKPSQPPPRNGKFTSAGA